MWAYNKRHKNGKYLFDGIGAKFQNAFASESDDNLYFQMRDHDIRKCPTCKSLPKRTHCGGVADLTRGYVGTLPEGTYLHAGCEMAYWATNRKVVLVSPMRMAAAQPQPASNCGYRYDGGGGKGFHEQDCPNRRVEAAHAAAD